MAHTSNITIRTLIPEDEEEAREHLRNFFFRDEPCCNYLGILTEDNPRCDDLESYSVRLLKNGLCLVAVDKGKIIGVCLNDLVEKGQPRRESTATNEKVLKVVSMMKHVKREVDYFNRYPDVDKLLYVAMTSVDSSYRGKGISKQLKMKATELGRNIGAQLISSECTSFYSATVSKSLGFDIIWTMDYTDYKVDGEVVFKLPHPHKRVQVLAMRL